MVVDEAEKFAKWLGNLSGKLRELETEIDGSDGRPKFSGDQALKYMAQNPNIKDPVEAYERMNADQLEGWEAESDVAQDEVELREKISEMWESQEEVSDLEKEEIEDGIGRFEEHLKQMNQFPLGRTKK